MAENLIGFGGPGGTAFTQYPITSGPITLDGGPGRAMANGSVKRGLRLRSVLIAGNGAARTFTASLAGSTFTSIAPAGAPDYQGYIGPLVLVTGGTEHSLTITPTGSIRLGRAGGGTTTDTNILNVSGTVGGAYALSQAPTAPGLTSVVPAGPSAATVTFTTPADDGNEALLGYRIVYANNVGFSGATTLDVDAEKLSILISGLTPGTWWFKVAARNAVTAAAGTSSVFSATVSVVLSASVGNLDGWAAFGALPAGLTPLVGAGVRRGAVYPLGAGAPTGLLREIQSTGAGSVAAGDLGIRRTMTGLKIGATYTLTGTMLALSTPLPRTTRYRFRVEGIGAGAAGTLAAAASAIPGYTFIATAATHVIRIEIAATSTWVTDSWFEAAAFYGITLTEIPNVSPYRLQDVVYEGPLSNHFSLACDTLGARWWCDRAGLTQFRQADSQDAILATFTDRRGEGLEYTGIGVSFNTRDLINMLKVTNHGRKSDGTANDLDYAFNDTDSITDWGPRSSSADMSLYVPAPVTNLIANPSAETNITGYTGGTSTVTRSGTYARFGSWCVRWQANATTQVSLNFGETVGTPVVAGRTYTASVYVRSSVARNISMLLRWRTAANGIVADVTSAAVASVTGDWTRLVFTATAPATATNLMIALLSPVNTNGQYHYADGLQLTETPAAVDYFDGSFPPDMYSYTFAGAAHASPSTRTSLHLTKRSAEILAVSSTPLREIRSIRWNAQEDPQLATRLEIQSRIRVEHRGETQDSRVLGIRHSIAGARWMIDLTLERSPS